MRNFDDAYNEGVPPWDIGRPQPKFIELLDAGRIHGQVLDVGCGTGENAIAFAARGHDVLGVDLAAAAIERARQKAIARRSSARFEVADALALPALGRSFDSVVDCAVFHVFDDEARAAYVRSLAAVVKPQGWYFMVVFSDQEPADWGGPRRVRRDEIESSFAIGWRIAELEPTRFETNIHPDGGKAWFAAIERVVA